MTRMATDLSTLRSLKSCTSGACVPVICGGGVLRVCGRGGGRAGGRCRRRWWSWCVRTQRGRAPAHHSRAPTAGLRALPTPLPPAGFQTSQTPFGTLTQTERVRRRQRTGAAALRAVHAPLQACPKLRHIKAGRGGGSSERDPKVRLALGAPPPNPPNPRPCSGGACRHAGQGRGEQGGCACRVPVGPARVCCAVQVV